MELSFVRVFDLWILSLGATEVLRKHMVKEKKSRSSRRDAVVNESD